MKKVAMILVVLIHIVGMSAPKDAAGKIFENQERRLEDERLRLKQKQRQTELENTKFENSSEIGVKEAVSSDNSKKFLITEINLRDEYNLLTKKEKSKIIGKYIHLELNSADITNLLTEFTNKLITKGYSTSVVTIMPDNDLTSGRLNLTVVPGKIGEIVINSGNGLDRLKEFFMFKTNKGNIFNIRDLDTATENFNSIQANSMTMEVLPGKEENTSKIQVRNILKNKYSVSLISNNYGDNKQDGIWRKGVSLNIDSPSGIGDNLYFTYLTVSRKNPDRNWKKRADELQPGEILPIGPAGYDPSKGDTLPYKRRLDMFNFGYTMKFRDYTLRLGSARSIQESSFYASNTVYDLYTSSHTLSMNLDKILFRNQKSKLTAGIGIKRKHNNNYLEGAVLSDRKLTVGTVNISYTTSLFKGIFGLNLGYERGLKIFGAERDGGKTGTAPKAQFNKYTLDMSYYRPIGEHMVYRGNIYSSLSDDTLYGSERQSIGGVGSVGGFHRSTVSGDRAVEIGNEISYNIPVKKIAVLSPYLGYGYGYVRINNDKSEYRKGYISGAVAGVRLDTKYLDFNFGYAKPVSYSKYLNPEKQEMYFNMALKVSF